MKSGVPIISNRAGAYVRSTDAGMIGRELQRLRSHSNETGLRADGLAIWLLSCDDDGITEGEDDDLFEAFA